MAQDAAPADPAATAGTNSGTPKPDATQGGGNQGGGVKVANDEPGEKVVIGFSGPAADHGWQTVCSARGVVPWRTGPLRDRRPLCAAGFDDRSPIPVPPDGALR